MTEQERKEKEIEDLIKMLDDQTAAGVSRVNIQTTDDLDVGELRKIKHHGRCDVGSAWASTDNKSGCD